MRDILYMVIRRVLSGRIRSKAIVLPPGGACKDRPDMWAPRTGAVLGDLQKPSEMHGRPQVQQPLRLDAYAMRLVDDAAGSN